MQRRQLLKTAGGLVAGLTVAKFLPKSDSAFANNPNALNDVLDLSNNLAFQPLSPLTNLADTTKKPNSFLGNLTAESKKLPTKPWKLLNPEFFLYNQQLPGAIIRVKEGDQFTALFTNNLSAASTIHFHGLRIPADQDGGPWEMVLPGETRPYQFTLDNDMQGNFWYHPHPCGITAEQVYHGLAGAMVVMPNHDPLIAIPQHDIFITGLRLDFFGRIDKNNELDIQHGRRDKILLVNGRVCPILKLPANSSHRFKIWNATNGRFMALQFFKNQAEAMGCHLIGTDGGYLQQPIQLQHPLLLSASERREIAIDFIGQKGDRFILYDTNPILPESLNLNQNANPPANWVESLGLRNMAELEISSTNNNEQHVHDHGGTPGVKLPLMIVELTDTTDFTTSPALTKPPAIHPLPKKLRTIKPLTAPSASNHQAFKKIRLNGVKTNLAINNQQFDMNRVDFVSNIGVTEQWHIINEADMTHSFHVHGGQFQLLSRKWRGKVTAPPYLAWVDTITIFPNEEAIILIRQDFLGLRMLHCHILEHEDHGMMSVLKVIN